MKFTQATIRLFFSGIIAPLLLLTACSEEPDQAAVGTPTDAQLQARLASILASRPDLPPELQVTVAQGRVSISGSLACETCAGGDTPGTSGTIQQSIGAVVRAVPGVTDVAFQFATE